MAPTGVLESPVPVPVEDWSVAPGLVVWEVFVAELVAGGEFAAGRVGVEVSTSELVDWRVFAAELASDASLVVSALLELVAACTVVVVSTKLDISPSAVGVGRVTVTPYAEQSEPTRSRKVCISLAEQAAYKHDAPLFQMLVMSPHMHPLSTLLQLEPAMAVLIQLLAQAGMASSCA
jgi:hypothetical protein